MDRAVLEEFRDYFNQQKGQSYPCSNQIVCCAVITKDRNKAIAVMETKGATLIRTGQNTMIWEFNHEHWVWQIWNTNARGYRFYKILIDEDIDKELFERVRVYCSIYCCSVEII